jgi:hypothetical protein
MNADDYSGTDALSADIWQPAPMKHGLYYADLLG